MVIQKSKSGKTLEKDDQAIFKLGLWQMSFFRCGKPGTNGE